MQLSMYDIIYMISNLFRTYIIYKFMMVLFDRSQRQVKGKWEFASYASCYVFITVIYLLTKISVIMLVSNICFFFLLTFNYKGSLKRRIFSVMAIYLTLMCIEVLLILFIGYFKLPILKHNDFDSVFGIVAMQIISYAVVIILSKYKHIKKGISIPSTYWICISVIPFASLYLMLLLLSSGNLKFSYVIIGIILILVTNFSVFYLYDKISEMFLEQSQKLLFAEQNKYYEKQLEIMKASLEATLSIRHDMKNQLLALQSLAKNHCHEELLQCLNDIISAFDDKTVFSHSGNVVVDSILNFKLQEASKLDAEISLDINLPRDLQVPAFDMATILGNLLDNAIDALKAIENRRMISVKIKHNRGQFIIKVSNTFNGIIIERDNNLVTKKKDNINHGLGIKNIKRILEKYDGSMDIEYNSTTFTSILLMYVD
ncbi:signal transduction histidine kinase regulating citrate/malate metabolism [[Clostridium] saccharolyticum WM1]|uniref:Signal transduction histidine kinase regulating citrate/malate metabolism n=2 Tax=Lacrimispora TaxID=2719231 RepID=D9R4H9_LACSW|nr:signal transduction histidine kinase regulating citrate/malate metabolism [[Clostridium] saccharolyticum WM1]